MHIFGYSRLLKVDENIFTCQFFLLRAKQDDQIILKYSVNKRNE